MVREELGDTIDIHLGGADLIFPHHENEIAQSESATGSPLARCWLHNGMVNVGGEKMSKSLGNFTTIRALLESGVSAMTLRLFVLQAHYRKPLDFTAQALQAAATGWEGLDAALAVGSRYRQQLQWNSTPESTRAEGECPLGDELMAARQRFIEAMDDDLNTAAALGELFELGRPLRSLAHRLRIGDEPSAEDRLLAGRWQLLVELTGVLGLRTENDGKGPAKQEESADRFSDERIEALVEQRRSAKAARDYSEADRLRAELKAAGVELVDKPGGVTVWLRT